MPPLPYHLVELSHRTNVAVALGNRQFASLELVSVWNGRDISEPEPGRRHAPSTPAAPPLVDTPEQMVRLALEHRPMSVAAMSRHYRVSRAVFARAVARMQAAGELRIVRTERVPDPRGGTRLTRVYRLAAR